MTDDEPSTVTAAEQLAEAAAVMRAEWVLTVFTTPPASGVLQQCAKLIGEGGAGMAVEFSPLGPVSTIRDAMEVVHTARRGGRAAVLIDSWHFCFGASTWDDLATLPIDDIAYVQFTDALEPESRERLTRETLHRRALPGEGVLELDRFAGTLLDRGFAGLVSAEVLSAELRNLHGRDPRSSYSRHDDAVLVLTDETTDRAGMFGHPDGPVVVRLHGIGRRL